MSHPALTRTELPYYPGTGSRKDLQTQPRGGMRELLQKEIPKFLDNLSCASLDGGKDVSFAATYMDLTPRLQVNFTMIPRQVFNSTSRESRY